MADCKTAMSGSTAMVGTLSKMSTMAVGCCIDSTATGRGLGMDSMTDSGEGMNQANKGTRPAAILLYAFTRRQG